MRKTVLLVTTAGILTAAASVWGMQQWLALRQFKQETRVLFFAALRPVRLANCNLERFGSPHDGGYLMCANLLGAVESAYSYGIANDDNWGCDVSRRYHVPVHEYDCFDLRRPVCQGGALDFHEECVGGATKYIDNRAYGSIATHVSRNGDVGKRLVVKLDVEGAELDALLAVPDDLLLQIDQLVVEIHNIVHGMGDPVYLRLMEKLGRTFLVAYVHANNYACRWAEPPFTSGANELLFVNRRIAIVDGSDSASVPVSPLATSNHPDKSECQPRWP